jgi:hypothetical protein
MLKGRSTTPVAASGQHPTAPLPQGMQPRGFQRGHDRARALSPTGKLSL